MNLIPTKKILQEKVKELTCIHEISMIISNSVFIEKEILNKIIAFTKKAHYRSHAAIVKLHVSVHNFLLPKLDIERLSK